MRATTSAVLFFVLNLIGMGGGPLFVGMLSDALVTSFGAEAMRISLIVTLLLATTLATSAYTIAARALRADLDPAPSVS
jgi:cation transporter-like permease